MFIRNYNLNSKKTTKIYKLSIYISSKLIIISFMEQFFTIENIGTLFMLILLQAVLGFDNLLYISLESAKVEEKYQSMVRKLGILIALVLRIVLLFLIFNVIKYFQDPILNFEFVNILEASFNVHSIIVLVGGVFIIYTAMKEISHMLILDDVGLHLQGHHKSSLCKSISLIVIMNMVFSFDSILSAIALSDIFLTMAIAIIISAFLMVALADRVADFLNKNRMYEVLGLFILLIVGVMLISEGGHLAHLKVFGFSIEPMAKSTFYFVVITMVLVEMAQSKYQKKLLKTKMQISKKTNKQK